MIQIPRICANTFNYSVQSIKEIMPVCKTVVPYFFAAAIFSGLKQKAETVSHDTLIYVTSNLLLGSQWLFTCAAVAAILYVKPEKKAEIKAPSIKTKKVVKYVISKKEFESMKAEIIRLKQELDEAKNQLNRPPLIQHDSVISKKIVVVRDIPKNSTEVDISKIDEKIEQPEEIEISVI